MSNNKISLLILLIILEYAYGNIIYDIFNKIKTRIKKNNEDYDEQHSNRDIEYPRDKKENPLNSSDWRSYVHQPASTKTKSNVLSRVVVAYEGAAVKLPCPRMLPEDRCTWKYSRSLNLSLKPLEDKDNTVEERDALSIYNVRKEDAGVYTSQIGSIVSGFLVLEIVDDEYNVVKPLTSRGPYATPPRTVDDQGLTVFSSWSPWSECSTCGGVGRRRRFGMCYVRSTDENEVNGINEDNASSLDENLEIFKDFPEGLPCGSEILPKAIRSSKIVSQRRNEIMIGLCKVPCKNTSRQDFDVFLKKQPTLMRDIVFAKEGQTIKLRCPGAILRDVPYNWRVGDHRVAPRSLLTLSGGRARIDARDRLVLEPAVRRDSNAYSCEAGGTTAGHILIIVK